jgi:hypothetical protein
MQSTVLHCTVRVGGKIKETIMGWSCRLDRIYRKCMGELQWQVAIWNVEKKMVE